MADAEGYTNTGTWLLHQAESYITKGDHMNRMEQDSGIAMNNKKTGEILAGLVPLIRHNANIHKSQMDAAARMLHEIFYEVQYGDGGRRFIQDRRDAVILLNTLSS